ncbi:DUF2059 domain-containing protein, partial [Pelomonas sp. KK5]|uniref:DUF2059 domain-containing protein n=1 Tax=Pelomonas sp. KK5 TaxID=1855730 RepID=UPI001301E680
MMKKSLIAASLFLAASGAFAQAASAPAITPSKLALINKVIALQQPGIENISKMLVQQMLTPLAQGVSQALAQQPADKREALAKGIQAEVNKFGEDSAAELKNRGQKLAGPTWTPILDERFTEDDLKQTIAWLESPTSKKLQQAAIEMSNGIGPKMFADAKPTLEPKYHALEASIAKQLGITPKPTAGASTPPP